MANPLSEDDIIQTFFAPLAKGFEGAFGMGDDAARLMGDASEDIVVTLDTLTGGVHFFADDAASDVAIKALGVNLSDLAAKGAEPRTYLLSLALPRHEHRPDREWLQGFAGGLRDMQERHGCVLIGGDTVASDATIMISITALGAVPAGEMVLRSGARPGDTVFVSGTIGDGALGLRLRANPGMGRGWGLCEQEEDYLRGRYLRPEPRTALAPVLRRYASAAMDVSDGLAGDFAKLCAASSTGGVIEAGCVPFSAAARAALAADGGLLEPMLTGGDDYEIIACVGEADAARFASAAKAAGVGVAAAGRITQAGEGVRVLDEKGADMVFATASFSHF